MRKATEDLLKVIGTDSEIGTHGAIERTHALASAIKGDVMFQKVFPEHSFDSTEYRQALVDLIPFYNQISCPSFRRLMFFAESLKLNKDREIGEAIKSSYALPPWCKEQLP